MMMAPNPSAGCRQSSQVRSCRCRRICWRLLKTLPAAKAAFAALSPSHRHEYLEWIVGAKRAATREKRIATAVEWLGEGKSLHWKYERKEAS